MSLHEHDVNNRRMDAGLRPVNSMWIWGGGCAPEPVARAMPVLFSDDPLLRGIWHSCRGLVQAWSDSFDNMLDAAGTDCVAVCPDTASARSGTAMASYIAQLKNLATQRRPGKLTLIFRDGITVTLRPADRFRFWRDIGPVLRDAAVQ